MSKARDLANSADVFDTVSTTELGYLDGVTSNIQTQIDSKTGGVATDTPPASPTEGQVWLDTDGTTADAEYVLKSTLSSTGDIFYASSANTPARLGIGSTDQVLKVSGGVPVWAAAAAGGKVLQVVSATTTTGTSIATTTLTDTTITATITPTSASSKILLLITAQVYYSRVSTILGLNGKLFRGATELYSWNPNRLQYLEVGGVTEIATMTTPSISYLDSPATTSSTTYKLQAALSTTANSAGSTWQYNGSPSTITLLEIGA